MVTMTLNIEFGGYSRTWSGACRSRRIGGVGRGSWRRWVVGRLRRERVVEM